MIIYSSFQNEPEIRWRHQFLTTNWDFLLQQEIDQFVPDGVPVPRWLGNNSHVFHLNGTVEVRPDNSHRSEFVLREDSERNLSTEVNIALSEMVWGSTFVVVGMSFECKPDKALFNILNSDMLPIGKSNWIIVNPCQTDLDNARDLINCRQPLANVTPVPWVEYSHRYSKAMVEQDRAVHQSLSSEALGIGARCTRRAGPAVDSEDNVGACCGEGPQGP